MIKDNIKSTEYLKCNGVAIFYLLLAVQETGKKRGRSSSQRLYTFLLCQFAILSL
jgi:hypothetical protein